MGLEYMQGNQDVDNINYEELIKSLISDQDSKNSQSLFQNTDMVKLVKTYLDEEIPEHISPNLKKHFWAVLGNTVKLTFLDKEDVMDMELLFEQAKLNYTMEKPPYDFTFEDQQMLDELRTYFIAAVRRAVGSANHKFNERIILGGSINQVIRSNTESFKQGGDAGGFISKLKSLF